MGGCLALLAAQAAAQSGAVVGNDVLGRLQLGDQAADRQEDLLARAGFGSHFDRMLSVLAHFLGKKSGQRLKLGNGGVEQYAGGDGHGGGSKAELYEYTG